MVTEKGDGTRTMNASDFRAKCLALLDEVAESGEEIVITKRGKPVAKLAPYEDRPATLFGRDRDGIVMYDDLIEPVDVEWEAETNPDRVLNP
ncbi:MAG: type II toxin-antitoxin system prevent-host-death family antitoxin [Chloroflexi bacterium]|nr:type II toxin-antitoxin system prevent-host-death family antitoxin [Chloroflexota bacterium]